MPRCVYCKDYIPNAKNLSNHQSKSKRCLSIRAQIRADLASSRQTRIIPAEHVTSDPTFTEIPGPILPSIEEEVSRDFDHYNDNLPSYSSIPPIDEVPNTDVTHPNREKTHTALPEEN